MLCTFGVSTSGWLFIRLHLFQSGLFDSRPSTPYIQLAVCHLDIGISQRWDIRYDLYKSAGRGVGMVQSAIQSICAVVCVWPHERRTLIEKSTFKKYVG